jgi:cellulose synthase/poly-beta-1,6-N-acetylglucosamine synthase-like glycosyltransferase
MEGIIFTIISLLAVYGIVQLMAKVLFSIRRREEGCPVCVHRIIGVKNCQDSIETLIRSLVFEDIREEIIVADFGSTDETTEILKHLEREYDFLHIMTLQEYLNYMSNVADSLGKSVTM